MNFTMIGLPQHAARTVAARIALIALALSNPGALAAELAAIFALAEAERERRQHEKA